MSHCKINYDFLLKDNLYMIDFYKFWNLKVNDNKISHKLKNNLV